MLSTGDYAWLGFDGSFRFEMLHQRLGESWNRGETSPAELANGLMHIGK